MDSYKKGVKFEKAVSELFAELGYKNITRDRNMDGSRIDITAEHVAPDGSAIKYIIECKDYKRNVGIDDINKFALVYSNLRNSGKIHKGVIVSKSGFTAQGRQAAEAYGLELYEYESLLKKVKKYGLPPDKIEPIKEERPKRKYVFTLMPLDKKLEDTYHFGIRSAAEDANLDCARVDEINYEDDIEKVRDDIEKVKEEIMKADIIVAEMSDKNPNVLYEVGLAHAWKKNTILIVRESEEIVFDLRGQDHIVYEGSIKTLRSKLKERLLALK